MPNMQNLTPTGQARGFYRHQRSGVIAFFSSRTVGFIVQQPHHGEWGSTNVSNYTRVNDLGSCDSGDWRFIPTADISFNNVNRPILGRQYQCTLVPFFVGEVDWEVVDLWLHTDTMSLPEAVSVAEPYKAYSPTELREIIKQTVDRAIAMLPEGAR